MLPCFLVLPRHPDFPHVHGLFYSIPLVLPPRATRMDVSLRFTMSEYARFNAYTFLEGKQNETKKKKTGQNVSEACAHMRRSPSCSTRSIKSLSCVCVCVCVCCCCCSPQRRAKDGSTVDGGGQEHQQRGLHRPQLADMRAPNPRTLRHRTQNTNKMSNMEKPYARARQ